MKATNYVFLALVLMFCPFSCQTDDVLDSENSIDPNFRVIEDEVNLNSRTTFIKECFSTELIAGQNENIGEVNFYIDGDDIVVTYLIKNDEWQIKESHLSIGDCGEQVIPTTGANNPKIGRFAHRSKHAEGTNKVEYYISQDVVSDDEFCFAAHAVVQNINSKDSETAWANGIDFGGNSWAMFVQTRLSECSTDEIEE